jgi:hypothetical protein
MPGVCVAPHTPASTAALARLTGLSGFTWFPRFARPPRLPRLSWFIRLSWFTTLAHLAAASAFTAIAPFAGTAAAAFSSGAAGPGGDRRRARSVVRARVCRARVRDGATLRICGAETSQRAVSIGWVCGLLGEDRAVEADCRHVATARDDFVAVSAEGSPELVHAFTRTAARGFLGEDRGVRPFGLCQQAVGSTAVRTRTRGTGARCRDVQNRDREQNRGEQYKSDQPPRTQAHKLLDPPRIVSSPDRNRWVRLAASFSRRKRMTQLDSSSGGSGRICEQVRPAA